MKRSRAFTLTEILTGTILQAGFILVLMGAFYMLVNFQTENTKLIAARERGQRVLAYIENRVMHAGLGLWKCGSPSEIRNAFGNNFTAFNTITLPVAVTNSSNIVVNTNDGWPTTDTLPHTDGIYRGNILTVLYAIPELSSEYIHSKSPSNTAFVLYNGSASKDVVALSADKKLGCNFIYSDNENYTTSNFNHSDSSNSINNLKSWAVTHSSGYPLYLDYINKTTKSIDGKNCHISLSAKYETDISSGSELLYVRCEKIFVDSMSFIRINLGDANNWSSANSAMGVNKVYENGILEVYFELDTNTNILDCYILVSGGRDPSLNTQCPASWPTKDPHKARWLDEYKYHEVYVSRASWKLHNINWDRAAWTHY